MTYREITLLGVDRQGTVLSVIVLPAYLGDGHLSILVTLLMMVGYLLITPGSRLIRSVVAEEVKVTRVVVTPMKLSPLQGGERKRMDFRVRFKYPNLGARRVILMM